MTDKNIKNIYKMSDDAIIHTIGEFVRHHRLQQNITQKDLADRAGINRTTLSDMELGRRCQLVTLIQVLRILNKLHVFESFEVTQQISPIKLAEMEMKKRQKASGQSGDSTAKKSDW
ncbi:MAG: helix-turn-helix domain-containing protein [Crocinitomicaceae bacterium]|jgi:transcriptional regulator with XRE-family HTH domain|nr:helix-turn-helix domain-containing protein [Crocinitomicaceae bacterium]